MKYKVIFVVLVYRNANDLIDFIVSVKEKVREFKIIVVNAFYDSISKEKIEKIAIDNECDFLNVDNKGYSFGNHFGIDYAQKNYSFDYLIISNPDIVVELFDFDKLSYQKAIIAPKIIANCGKYQNPMMVNRSKLSERVVYRGFKNNSKLSFWFGIIINKLKRELFLLFNKNKNKKIYMAHGAFIIFSCDSLALLNYKPFDENLFLFSEESVLAYKAQSLNIPIIYNPSIHVKHKEDGSMKIANINTNSLLGKSNIYYFEKYVKKGQKEHC